MKKVLLTNIMACDYTGSELHIVSIAKQFIKLNYEVTCAVVYSAYPIKLLLENIGVKIIHITEESLSEQFFDIIFSQHGIILDYLLFNYKIRYDKLIISVLSPIENLEAVTCYANNCVLSLANSFETKQNLIVKNFNCDEIIVFPNYAESEFFDNFKIENNRKLNKIAIISNHLPKEIKELYEKFNENGFVCDIIGMEGNKLLVTTELLSLYDLVITIGKTVQYCFAQGIPVYCYDIWGGPGYLDRCNFEKAEKFNFSGRGFDKKLDTDNLYDDIVLKYDENLKNIEYFNEIAKDRFCLDKNFNKMIEIVMNKNKNIKNDIYINDLDSLRSKNKALIFELYNRFKNSLGESEVYFDFGNGFKQEFKIQYYFSIGTEINLDIYLPEGVKNIRFDPIGGKFCSCSFFCFKDNNDKLEVKAVNTDGAIDEYDIFFTLDPKYYIENVLGEKKIKIKYTVNALSNQEYEIYNDNRNQLLENSNLNMIRINEELNGKSLLIEEKDKVIFELNKLIQEKDEALFNRDKLIQEKDEALSNRDKLIQEKDEALFNKDKLIREKHNILFNKNHKGL